MKQSGRIIFIVFLLAAAIAISIGVHFILQGKVKAGEEAKQELAMKEVFPDAVSYDDAEYTDRYLKQFLTDNGYASDQVSVSRIIFARDAQREVRGIVADVISYKRFGGNIHMLVGIQNDKTVNGYSVLKITDAKGLDLKVKDASFKDQFVGKKADSFLLVNYEVKQPNEVLPANGADDASQSVVRGVNAAILSIDFIDEVYGGMLN